jgi:hypothetical protein
MPDGIDRAAQLDQASVELGDQVDGVGARLLGHRDRSPPECRAPAGSALASPAAPAVIQT